MEYIVIGLLVLIVGLLWYKQPQKIQGAFTDSLIKRIEENKQNIAKGVYDKLPDDVKSQLPERLVKASVEEIVEISIDTIKEGIK